MCWLQAPQSMSTRIQVQRPRLSACLCTCYCASIDSVSIFDGLKCLILPAGDPNTNWAWFENQKKVETNLRLRFSLGSADDMDGLNENHGAFSETRSANRQLRRMTQQLDCRSAHVRHQPHVATGCILILLHLRILDHNHHDVRWERLGPSVIEKGYKIGISSDFWNRYEEDIGISKELCRVLTRSSAAIRRQVATMWTACRHAIDVPCSSCFECMLWEAARLCRHQLTHRHVCVPPGCNSFRLSLEWSRIFPQRGVIDQSAVDRYHQIFDCLDR